MGSNNGQVIATPSEEFSMKATRPFRPKFVASTARLSTCIVEKYRWPWGMGGAELVRRLTRMPREPTDPTRSGSNLC